MAISIGDALLKLGVDTTDLDKGMQGITATIQKHQKAIGIGMVAAGGTILAVGGMAIKTASDIEEMTAKFDVVFGNTAEGVKEWAKTTSEAMGRSRYAMMEMAASVQDTFVPMGFAREEAAKMSKRLTELAIDVGSFNNKLDVDVMRDFQSALVGQTETVRKYGIVITAAGIEQEILNQGWVESKSDITEAMKIQARMNMILAGTTDAQGDAIRTSGSFANQMKRLKAQVEVVSATIGENLLPIITSAVGAITGIVEKISAWAAKHPGLTKVIIIGTAALGLLLVAFGSLLLLMPGLIASLPILGLAFHAALGPIGLITLAVTALIAAGIALWKNWDKVVAFFSKAWENIKIFFLKGIYSVLDSLSKFTRFIPGLNNLVDSAKEKISSMIDVEEVKKDARKLQAELDKLADEMVETLRNQLEEERDLKLKAVQDSKDLAQKEHDDRIEELRKTYGVLEREDEDYQETKLDAARRATEEMREQYDRDIEAARDAYDEKIKLIDAEYSARLKLLDDETAAIISEYQRQIDAIDDRTEAEEKAVREAERESRLLELKGAVESAKTEEDKLVAIAELEDYQARIDRERLLESRRAEKDALRDAIDDARNAASQERDRLAEELQEKKTQERALLDETVNRLETEKAALDSALEAELIRINNERIAFEAAEAEKLAVKMERLDEEEKELAAHYEYQLSETQLHVAAMNAATAQLQDRDITITTTHRDVYEEAPIPSYHEEVRPGLQQGGIAMRPMVARIAERRPEAVIPLDRLDRLLGGKTINLYVELDGRIIGQAIGQPLVDIIRVKTGLKV